MEKGTLVRWNSDKGFGFIKPETRGDTDVFIHISTLKHMARKPLVGDEILFHRENQPDGKVKAVKASIEGVAVIAGSSSAKVIHTPLSGPFNLPSNNKTHHSPRTSSGSIMGRIILVLVVLNLGIYGFNKYQDFNATPIITNEDVEQMQWAPTAQPRSIIPSSQFRCEAGKTHCSQMRSCAEATFYINNCPGTKMDGNGDGVPCERQFCD
ncbi:excalibur calcium-binding domain-containing protein [Shewanella sp. OMA3-2]|uniref:excalibur calcium-binding domain-containing protein n=1 Tax=Shewanella sp. OMA3-2 TaxID=2908650 RepID=UPI001F234BD0|nr:excalibur calcium-binding domain-containing protein [Shewanella sp. OMA3-2]UJF21942.1 excalibur calcium-binding domain-containing protein [Shewanella sp. OMA3-2]